MLLTRDEIAGWASGKFTPLAGIHGVPFTVVPELATIQSGLLVDYRAGELMTTEHGYISLSVGLHGTL
jgi:hypothetical protein